MFSKTDGEAATDFCLIANQHKALGKRESAYALLEDGTDTRDTYKEPKAAVAVPLEDGNDSVVPTGSGDDGGHVLAPNNEPRTEVVGPDGVMSSPELRRVLFLSLIVQESRDAGADGFKAFHCRTGCIAMVER